MFFLLFLCDLVFLGGAKKSLIFGLYHQKPNITNDFKCIKSQRFCTTEEKERELRYTEEKIKLMWL
jgi:hypothetical protein